MTDQAMTTIGSRKQSGAPRSELFELTLDWSQLAGNSTYEEFLRTVIKNPEEAIKILDACTCCTDHPFNRPKKLSIWKETSFANTQTSEKGRDCTCRCRHLSRFICRAFCQEVD